MKNRRILKITSSIFFAFLTAAIPLLGSGCGKMAPPNPVVNTVSGIVVPGVDLDLIVYVDQGVPTKIPRSLLGTANDVAVDSLTIWGIVKENQYYLSGALIFDTAAGAEVVNARLPKQSGVWTKISDRTLYFVQGSGGESEALKNAISKNNLKRFDDRKALDELAIMPSTGTTNPAAIAIIKPNQAMITQVRKLTNEKTATEMENIFNSVKPQLILVGLYSTQPIDIADLMQRVANNTIWDVNLGVLVSIGSIYPGVVFSPIATKMIENQGYPKEQLDGLTVYRSSFEVGKGKTIPVLINISGNHIFTAISAKEDYAQLLLTGVHR